MIHLDTSFLVDVLRESRRQPGPAMNLLDRLENMELAISVHALCELYAGAELSRDSARERQAIERLCGALHVRYPDERFAAGYGSLLAILQKGGKGISTMDLLIATSALLDQAPLVTRNLDHFSRIAELEILTY